MTDIHIILQGKGGVGKSVVASFITQYLLEKGKSVSAFDTDPVNKTFAGYEALDVKRVEIMDGEDINPRKFDDLIEEIAEIKVDAVVIDNGASSFVALASYLNSNDVVNVLESMGHKVFIHSILTGGQAQKDTLQGFSVIAKSFGSSKGAIVVWLNEFWGEVNSDGKGFEQMKVYKDNVDAIHAIVTIPSQKTATFGQDMSLMLTAKLTFDEALNGGEFQLMAKQRIKMIKRDLFDNMSVAI